MQLPSQGSLEGEALTQLMERVLLLLCSVEQMQRCAEGLSVLTEPVKRQVLDEPDNSVIAPPDANAGCRGSGESCKPINPL